MNNLNMIPNFAIVKSNADFSENTEIESKDQSQFGEIFQSAVALVAQNASSPNPASQTGDFDPKLNFARTEKSFEANSVLFNRESGFEASYSLQKENDSQVNFSDFSDFGAVVGEDISGQEAFPKIAEAFVKDEVNNSSAEFGKVIPIDSGAEKPVNNDETKPLDIFEKISKTPLNQTEREIDTRGIEGLRKDIKPIRENLRPRPREIVHFDEVKFSGDQKIKTPPLQTTPEITDFAGAKFTGDNKIKTPPFQSVSEILQIKEKNEKPILGKPLDFVAVDVEKIANRKPTEFLASNLENALPVKTAENPAGNLPINLKPLESVSGSLEPQVFRKPLESVSGNLENSVTEKGWEFVAPEKNKPINADSVQVLTLETEKSPLNLAPISFGKLNKNSTQSKNVRDSAQELNPETDDNINFDKQLLTGEKIIRRNFPKNDGGILPPQINPFRFEKTGTEFSERTRDFREKLQRDLKPIFPTPTFSNADVGLSMETAVKIPSPAEQVLAEFAEILSDKIKFEKDSHTVRLKLRPEDLGEVELLLETASNGEISAKMTVEKESTRQILTENLPQLRENLQNNGWEIKHLEVIHQGFSGNNDSAQSERKPTIESTFKDQNAEVLLTADSEVSASARNEKILSILA